jgi:uncharacterized protein (TIGR03086 family)
MSDAAARFERVADGFDAVVTGVDDWSAVAPCEGWVARDVVRHLVEWVPGMFASVGMAAPEGSVDDDPLAAWRSLRTAISGLLADPAAAERTMQFGPAGEHSVPDAVDRFVTPDVLVHSWDLARATGQQVELDAEVATGTVMGFRALGDALAKSGHFAPAVPMPNDAPVGDQLIALSGRDPSWSRP